MLMTTEVTSPARRPPDIWPAAADVTTYHSVRVRRAGRRVTRNATKRGTLEPLCKA